MSDIKTMPLICLRCKKDIPLSMPTFKEISYTHYSYCEECLRKGLKSLRSWDVLYKRIYDHHYEILKMEEGEAKRAKLSLSNWVLDLMTSDLDYDYVTDINVGKIESDDLISRQAVLNMKRLFIDEDGIMAYAVPTGNILRLLSVQPTRPTARWERFKDDYNNCSKCGGLVKFYHKYKYCPECGAKMQEEEE